MGPIPVDCRIGLPDDDRAPVQARRAVGRLLTNYPHAVIRDVQLVASELVTNAVLYGGGVRWFGVDPDDGIVQVAVADSSPEPPSLLAERPAIGGFGLGIVDELSDEWGFELNLVGKVVWSVMDCR